MDTVIVLLVLSTLTQFVVPKAAPVASFRAILEIESEHSRIFSGERLQLKCSVPDVRSNWSYMWFKGSERLSHQGETFTLWKTHINDGGKYYCQGVRNTVVGDIHTLQSLPVEINVEGGWALLQVPSHPGLVGHGMGFTCRIRGSAPLHEVILYKDGVEVMRQRGPDQHLYLTNLTLEDHGMYSCRASWDTDRRTHSIISSEVPVQVLEVVSRPVLEIDADNELIPKNMLKLICHSQYNAPAPAPPIHYFFYKNNERLGTATSENNDIVRRTPGQYSCKVKVPELDLLKWSEPKSFGQGPQEMTPPIYPRDSWSLAPPVSPPLLPPPPAAVPTAARPSPHQSTAAPAFIQPTAVGTQSSGPLLKTSLPMPSTLPSTVQSLIQTAILETDSVFEDSDDMLGESGDMPEGSGDMPEGSGDMPEGSGDMPEGSGALSLGSSETVPFL